MANNLRALREARGLNQSQAAAALGTALSQYAKLERGERMLSTPWIARAAAAYGIDTGEVVSSTDGGSLPVLGSIEVGGVVRWHDGAPPVAERRGVLTVADGALGSMFDGARLVTRCQRVALRDLVSGRPYLLLASGWLLRTAHAAQTPGTWHLIGFNAAPAFDQAVAEAIECDGLAF